MDAAGENTAIGDEAVSIGKAGCVAGKPDRHSSALHLTPRGCRKPDFAGNMVPRLELYPKPGGLVGRQSAIQFPNGSRFSSSMDDCRFLCLLRQQRSSPTAVRLFSVMGALCLHVIVILSLYALVCWLCRRHLPKRGLFV